MCLKWRHLNLVTQAVNSLLGSRCQTLSPKRHSSLPAGEGTWAKYIRDQYLYAYTHIYSRQSLSRYDPSTRCFQVKVSTIIIYTQLTQGIIQMELTAIKRDRHGSLYENILHRHDNYVINKFHEIRCTDFVEKSVRWSLQEQRDGSV